jgi:capsular exopolysaccharide synthesis family protein
MYPEEQFHAEAPQEKTKHLRDYLRVVLKRKGLLLTAASIVFLSTLLSVSSKTPIYTASTKVLIEKNLDVSRMEGFSGYMLWDPDFQATQLELLRSFNVALRVAKSLDSGQRRHFQTAPAAPGAAALLRDFSAAALDSSEALLRPFIGPKETAAPAAAAAAGKSGPEQETERIAAQIQASIRVEPVRDTKIVTLFCRHKNPAVAQMVANAAVQAYIDETLDIKSSTARHTLQWMTVKAAEEQRKLEISEKALQNYMREQDIVTVENRLVVLPERLSSLSKELAEAQTKEKEHEALHQQIERAGKNYSALEAIPVFAENSVLQSIRAQLLTAEKNVRELSRKYGEKHPVMQQALEEQRTLRAELRSETDRIAASVRSAYELAKSKVRDTAAMMNATKAELLEMNERFVQYGILSRDKEMNRTVFDALSSSIKKTDVTAQSMDVKIWPVQKAELPSVPSEPNKKRALLAGLIGGLISGLGLVFFLEYLDNTVNSAQSVEERYGLTVLGTVEELRGKKRDVAAFVRENPLSPLAESYRLIRSGLLLSTPERPPKVILITSMAQQEGKTTTTKNLAHILAQNEKKVLIIDCDMRRPRQHALFGEPNSFGLSSYLSGTLEPQQQLIRQLPENPVALLPAGPPPPNPAELLQSARMAQLLREQREQFDFILLDSPPVQQVTDSLALGPLADGTVLVVKAGGTTYEMLDSGIKRLHDSRAHLLGIVLNRLKKKHGDRGYYGYYSYYSQYRQHGGKS